MDNSKTTGTRNRLLKAAKEVFAKAGVNGATTKEIARVAGVNEVTLFRHFQSKEQLLSAVVQQFTALQAEALAHQEEWTQDLRDDLRHYALLYNAMLEEHEALIRTFIGEARRHPEAARRIIYETTQPLREKLITYLSNAQKRGVVRQDVDLRAAVDIFTGMLLGGMLRRSASPIPLGYSSESYLETSVDLFVSGISTIKSRLEHEEAQHNI